MARAIEDMSREELIGELPRRLLITVCQLAGMMVAVVVLGFIAIQNQLSILWTGATVAALMASPLLLSRSFHWAVEPARERFRRRRAMMREALAHVSWIGTDSRV